MVFFHTAQQALQYLHIVHVSALSLFVVLTGCPQCLKRNSYGLLGWGGLYLLSIIKYIMAQILFAVSLCQHQLQALVDDTLQCEKWSLSPSDAGCASYFSSQALLQTGRCLFPWQPILLRLIRYFQICNRFAAVLSYRKNYASHNSTEEQNICRISKNMQSVLLCKRDELRTIFNRVDEKNVNHTCVVRTLIYLG